MATVTSARVAAGIQPRKHEKGVFSETATYEASALPAADIIQMLKVAPGVTVLGCEVTTDALGTGVTIAVGDGAVADYLMAATVCTNAGRRLATGFPKTYTAADTLDITIGVGAATGTITMTAYFTRETVDLD